MNARYYDPETCRFINSDNNLEGGLNLFEYCHNNPINMTDYDGKDPVTVAAVVGAVVGILGGAVVGKAIADHFHLRGWHRWACISGGAALLGVVGGLSGPSVYAAISPLVTQSIANCQEKFTEAQKWILEALNLSKVWINQALRLISANTVKFSDTVSKHLNGDRAMPITTLIDCIKSGKASPDPQGAANRVMYSQTLWKNGKAYNLEVLVNWTNKTIEHYLYTNKK